MHSEDDEPVRIYSGSYEEGLFLVSVLQASDIPATLIKPPKRGGDAWHAVYVPKRYVPDSMPLIEDFNQRGKKTSW